MARRFLRLKLALLANGFRRSWQQTLGLVLGVGVIVPAATGIAIALAVGGRTGAAWAGPALVVVVAGAGLAWFVGPPLLFGIDETLDPARLVLLPLRDRDLVAGMFTASLVGLGPLATAILLAGGVAGFAPAGPGAALVLVALAAHLAVCVMGGRAATTALAAQLRSRRGRDLAGVLLAGGTLLVTQIPNLIVNVARPSAESGEDILRLLRDVGSALPLGWAARAALHAADGRLLAAGAWTLATLALAATLAWGWVVALRRTTTRPEQAAGAGRADAHLFPRILRFLPRNRFGANAARELRYLVREPRYRVATIVQVALSIVIIGAGYGATGGDPRGVFMAALLAVPFSLGSLNAFGADSGATWLLIAAGGDARADLAGKNVALWAVALPLILLGTLVLAGLTGGWRFVPSAFVTGAGLLLTAFGVGNLASVVVPFPQPEAGPNMFATPQGMGVVTMLSQMAAMALMLVLLLPVGLLAVWALLGAPALLPVAAAVALAYGAAVWWVGLRWAAGVFARNGPEILAALEPA